MSKIFEWEVPLQGSIYWSGEGGSFPLKRLSSPPPKKKVFLRKKYKAISNKDLFDDDFKESVKVAISRNAISANPDDKLTASNQKPLILWCPNLVTFGFYP